MLFHGMGISHCFVVKRALPLRQLVVAQQLRGNLMEYLP